MKSDFSALYDQSYIKLFQNPDECIVSTQNSLLNVQNEDEYLSLQQILGQAYMLKAESVQSVRFSLNDESRKENNPSAQSVYFDYILAEQYHNLRLFDQSKTLLSNLIQSKIEVGNPKSQPILFAKIYQLQAVNFMISKDYDKAMQLFKKSDSFLIEKSIAVSFVKQENLIFRANVLIANKKIEEAKKQLLQIKSSLEAGEQPKFLIALVSERLSNCYFIEKNYTVAIEELKGTLAYLGDLPFMSLKRSIYDDLSRNYLALNDMENYESFNKQFLDLDQKISKNQKDGISYLLKITKTLEQNNIELNKKKQSTKSLLIVGFSGLLLLLSGIYLYTEVVKTKNLKKQILFLDQRNKIESEDSVIVPSEMIASNTDVEKVEDASGNKAVKNVRQLVIPMETQQDILDKLKLFESTDFYLNKDVSLAVLASHLDTNIKYLSDVINNYKGKNFNAYINELRINYIVSLLETDSQYLNYKVSYLAEKAGFSSHSLFAAVFKQVTGISPNTFIKQLKA